MQQSRLQKYMLPIIALIVIVLVGVGVFVGKQLNASTTLADQNTQAPAIQEQLPINKTFSFPVNDSNGQKVTDISYTITSVDKQDQVIIKGQRASAVSGRTFFIINIKLTNTSSQTIQLNSRDYIRITAGKNSELYAADMYNDPIVVQPLSTEYTRLGFPIDSSEKQVTLHVGELSGQKTNIPVIFSK